MACEQTEYRLLLHAHNELSLWERLGVSWHLRRCPCCREARAAFEQQRWALADCLSSPLLREPATRLAPHLTSQHSAASARRSARLRSSALLAATLVLLIASIVLAYVRIQRMPGGAFYRANAASSCAPAPPISPVAPIAARPDNVVSPYALRAKCGTGGAKSAPVSAPATSTPASTAPSSSKPR